MQVRWAAHIKNRCSRVTKLIVDPGSPVGVAEALTTWMDSLELKLGQHDNIVCVYDVKLSGHPDARAHLRPPPFRQTHFERMVKGALDSLITDKEGVQMPDQTIFCCFDGGTHGSLGQHQSKRQIKIKIKIK